MASYEYSEADFHHEISGWHGPEDSWYSKFDVALRKSWDDAVENGYFRYRLSQMKTRILPGKYGFILQLNDLRSIERRRPESIPNLKMPFDPNKFNFTKVKPEELLYTMCPTHRSISNCEKTSTRRHLLLINVSPLEYGHVLLVPDADACIPQKLTETAVQMSIELMLLSAHPGLRVGFNSLCALASVNHLHVHAWYCNHPLLTEHVELTKIGDKLYEVETTFMYGFAFQLEGSTVEELTRCVFVLANHFQENDIAHNVFFTRGNVTGNVDQRKTVRAFVFPRKSVTGCKTEDGVSIFNVAVAELGGEIPMYAPDYYDKLTEDDITAKISQNMLPREEYEMLKKTAISLVEEL